jgi:hypothetical protein
VIATSSTHRGESPRIRASTDAVTATIATRPLGGSAGYSSVMTATAVHRQMAVTISKPLGLTAAERKRVMGVNAT